MKTSFKNCLRPNFRLLPPKNLGLENLGGGFIPPPPIAPLTRTPPLTKLKRISSSSRIDLFTDTAAILN